MPVLIAALLRGALAILIEGLGIFFTSLVWILSRWWVRWIATIAVTAFFWDDAKQKVDEVIAHVASIPVFGDKPDATGLLPYLNLANTFFPLSELFVFCASYFALIIALSGYKALKSWIVPRSR